MRKAARNLMLAAALLALSGACTRLNNKTPTPSGNLPPPNALGTAESPTQPATNPPSGGVPLALQVISPQDGAVVNTPEVLVTGMATPGAVVTVNDDIILVGDDGNFQSRVSLEQGANVIEIVASDELGNEQTIDLKIDYEP